MCVYFLENVAGKSGASPLCILCLIFSSILNLSTLMVFVCEVQKLV